MKTTVKVLRHGKIQKANKQSTQCLGGFDVAINSQGDKRTILQNEFNNTQ